MSNSLFAPYIPQMDDGVITLSDLQQGYVFVNVRVYEGVSRGDVVRCHFGNKQTFFYEVTDVDTDFPIIFSYPEADIPDGIYEVYYDATDTYLNTSRSFSSWAVVNRFDSGVLPAPVFIDKDDEQIINSDSVYENNGTHLKIMPYPNIVANDTLIISFFVTDNDGEVLPESQYAFSHRVQSNEVNDGVTALIPMRYILTIENGYCYAKYIVKPENSDDSESSTMGSAILRLSELNLLPAPFFSDANYGWLLSDDVTDGIHVSLTYPGMIAGDNIDLLLQGYDVNNVIVDQAQENVRFTISAPQQAEGYAEVTLPRAVADLVQLGRLDAYYLKTNSQGMQSSKTGTTGLDLTHANQLPAPIFINEVNGVITEESVNNANGTPIQITYSDMQLDDIITVYFSGIDTLGELVPAASYQRLIVVTEEDFLLGYIEVIIPPSNVVSVLDNGTVKAYYTVLYHNNLGFGISGEQSAIFIKGAQTMGINLILSTGSPPTDKSTINVSPFNRGFITGPAGTQVRASCSNGARIEESGASTYDLILNASGEGAFKMYNTHTGLTNVDVYNLLSPIEHIVGYAGFVDYTFGSGDFYVIANTTGAVANGRMPCSIYLKTNPSTSVFLPITMVRAIIADSSTASIQGYVGQLADILLDSDNSAEINILNTVAETITVMLSLPESSGSNLEVILNFQNIIQ